MGKIGIFLLGSFLIILFARAFKTPFDLIYTVMNTTATLSATESFAWRLMPYAIPIILYAILIMWVSGKMSTEGEG